MAEQPNRPEEQEAPGQAAGAAGEAADGAPASEPVGAAAEPAAVNPPSSDEIDAVVAEASGKAPEASAARSAGGGGAAEPTAPGKQEDDLDALLARVAGFGGGGPGSAAPGAAGGTAANAEIDELLRSAGAAGGGGMAGLPLDFDPTAAAMAAAIEAEARKQAASRESAARHAEREAMLAHARSLDLPVFGEGGEGGHVHGIDLLNDVNLQVKIELGRTRMTVDEVLRLDGGAVVELDKLAGDPADVLVNERLVARGEILVINDSFCIRINEIVNNINAAEVA